jgi:hypothetical protein
MNVYRVKFGYVLDLFYLGFILLNFGKNLLEMSIFINLYFEIQLVNIKMIFFCSESSESTFCSDLWV